MQHMLGNRDSIYEDFLTSKKLNRFPRRGYNAARTLSKDSEEEGDLPDNTGGRCCTNGLCSTSWDILCDALRPRRSSQKRKNKENGRNRVAWDFYSTVRVSFTAMGVVNSIEVTDSSWSIELSRSSHCLENQSLPVHFFTTLFKILTSMLYDL